MHPTASDRILVDPSAAFADAHRVRQLAAQLAPRVLRTDLTEPGHALLDLGVGLSPRDFRAHLVALGEALDDHYRAHFGGRLVFVSVSRFDQQAPTRPHRDGGPDASILLLGYEPTEVSSRLYLLDYTRCAHDRGQTPPDFLHCCNPAFQAGQDLLRDYTAERTDFTPAHYQVLLINNSILPYEERHTGMLGVLHHAVITPTPARSRPVDSVQMAVASPGVVALSADQMRAFVEAGTGAAR
jgi:hypothetical protein